MSTPHGFDIDTLSGIPPINACVFSLGSNLGDSRSLLVSAVRTLADTPDVSLTAVSPVYLTTPVGGVRQPDFLNLVVLADSHLPAPVLLDRVLAIEDAFGRVRGVLNGPRTLDIDLIAVGAQRSNTPRLQLPHPRAHERAFVLVPWLDVDPDAELPQGRVAELVAKLDTSGVRKTDHVIDLP